jgi:hypothetical protein
MVMKKLGALGLSAVLALSFSTSVFAATDTTSTQVSVQSGALSITSPSASVDFGTITVDGTIQTVNANLGTMNVADNRGTGDGWNVTVSASQFTQTGGVASPKVLPTNTFKLNDINSITQTVGSSALPTKAGTAPWTIDTGAIQILSAAVGDGLGTFDITFPASVLALDIDTAADVVDPAHNPTSYASTITWTIATGP